MGEFSAVHTTGFAPGMLGFGRGWREPTTELNEVFEAGARRQAAGPSPIPGLTCRLHVKPHADHMTFERGKPTDYILEKPVRFQHPASRAVSVDCSAGPATGDEIVAKREASTTMSDKRSSWRWPLRRSLAARSRRSNLLQPQLRSLTSRASGPDPDLGGGGSYGGVSSQFPRAELLLVAAARVPRPVAQAATPGTSGRLRRRERPPAAQSDARRRSRFGARD